jgi:YD repeat-containing protein
MGQEFTLAGIRDRLTIAILDGIWHEVRMEYGATGLLVYRGVHEIHDAAITDGNWEVWKYTYDTNGRVTRIEGPVQGTWDGRASIAWGA